MKVLGSIWISVLAFVSTIGIYAAGDPEISLSRVSPDGGVAITSVMCIEEDRQGFIWFGTNNGLFKYNSQEIKKYNYSQSDKNSLPTNRINQMMVDNQGQLIIATEEGLCKYNHKYDNFTRLSFIDQFNQSIGNDISSLVQTRDSIYWMIDEKGVSILNFVSFEASYINVHNHTSRPRLLNLDNDGNLWIVFQDGHIYYKPEESSSFILFARGPEGLPRSFLADNDKIWIGYDSKGLLCFDVDGNYLIHYTEQNEFISNRIRSIVKSGDGSIWVGTYNGIAIIDSLSISEVITPRLYPKLPHQSVWSLYKDSNNIIWIGTWLGGLCFNSEYRNSVTHFTRSNRENSISYNIISSFVQDPDGIHIWVGTESGLLNQYNQVTQSFSEVQVLYNGEKIKNIRSLAFDDDGRMWIGTRENGLIYRDRGVKEFQRLETPFLSGLQILSLYPVKNGLWISDYQQGVVLYSFDSKTFTRYKHNPLSINSLSDNHVRQMLKDREGNMWFATENGLNLLPKDSKEFTHFFHVENDSASLSVDYIYCMMEDAEGKLWLGTNGGGLTMYNPDLSEFKHYTQESGLPGNEIYTIIEDANTNLWLATDNGICKFHPKSNEVLTFGNIEGIYNNRFNPNTGLITGSGLMFFGGSNGVVSFKPNETMVRNPIMPKAIITSLYISNEEILPGQTNNILSTHISETESIRLNSHQSSFSFRFVANNYINPDKNRFSYRLSGFEEYWTETDINSPAIYRNIPSGKFVFELRASNNDGLWNEIPTRVKINVIPPFWARWYSIILYMVAIIFLVHYFRRQTISRHELKNQIELEKVKQESNERLHQAKLQFFTNISHEFRTPLTLIYGPINRLLKLGQNNKDIVDQLTLVKSNSERLLRLINQILDFRKIEAGKMKLNPVKGDIVAFCRDLFHCFSDHAEHRSIAFNFHAISPYYLIDFDPEKLDKIIFNILSNAFKYCPDGGKIETYIRSNKESGNSSKETADYTVGNRALGEYVEISITDTGRGIHKENLSQIFERFYHADNDDVQGTGIGLALARDYIQLHKGQIRVYSEPGKGTEFRVLLPLNQAGALDANISSSIQTEETSDHESESAGLQKNIEKSDTQLQNSLILIVEDNLEVLNFLADLLSNYFRIAKARNGKEALEQVHSLFPDLIVSDIVMPEMDGIELCETLKTDIRTSHIPIILLTALDTNLDRISGLTSGGDAYISKPFDDDLLVVQIINLLESRKKLQESFTNYNDKWEANLDSLDVDKKFVLKAIKIVEANLPNYNFSVENLAKELSLSRTHLHRKLKSLSNQSATEFIRYVRLRSAVKLLREGKHKVNEVGYAVGFNSHTYFTKSFKKYYGVSPTEFMKDNAYGPHHSRNE